MRETKATISGAQLIHILQLWKSCYLWRQPHNRGLVTSCHPQTMEKQQFEQLSQQTRSKMCWRPT